MALQSMKSHNSLELRKTILKNKHALFTSSILRYLFGKIQIWFLQFIHIPNFLKNRKCDFIEPINVVSL